MKTMFLLFCLVLACSNTYAQAQEGTVTYQKSQEAAAVIELPYSPDIVKDAMNDYLSKKGRSKGIDIKGFTTFRNTQPAGNKTDNADIYFKVERKSRQEKEVSVISLLLTVPKEGPATATTIKYMNMEQAKAYLNELAPAIIAYDLELRIKEQNEAVIKSESKYKGLTDDGADLEKKRAGIEDKARDNKKEQEAQATEVESQKQKLAALVGQRK